MTFLAPLFLIGSAAAIVPIVLHLLKREPEPRVKFPAVRLLKRATVERTDKRQLRELVLLALRVAAIVLLALAFARPFVKNGTAFGASGVTMVVVDTSYSLSGPGRFERSRELARKAIDGASSGDLVGVVAFSDAAEVVSAPMVDRALARAAVGRLSSGFGSTRYLSGLNAAVHALGGRHGTIVVVTDLQESGWDAGEQAAVPESARIEIADVGAEPANLAVTSIRGGDGRVVASIRNDGAARTARVRLSLDGRAAAETAAALAPNTTVDVEFPIDPRRGHAATATVAVDDRDGLQADNVRYIVLDHSERPVLIVTSNGDLGRDAFYLEQALAATPLGASGVAGVSGAQLSGWDAQHLATHSAVFVLSTRGLERRGREALATYARAGGGVIVVAGPEIDGAVIADVLGAGTTLTVAPVIPSGAQPQVTAIAPSDVRHPIFQAFGAKVATLGLVKFANVARVSGTGCETVARFASGEAALLDCAAGKGRAIVVASDLNNRWNDFALHPTFVPFVHELVRYVSSGRPDAGEYLVGDARVGAHQTPGVISVDGRRVAVNVDPRESDPSRLTAAEFQSAVSRLKGRAASTAAVEAKQQEDGQHLWTYLVMAMLGILLLEGLVAARS